MNPTSPLITRARQAVDRRPLAAFFLLAFAFSWLFWLFSRAVSSLDPFTARHLVAAGAFGPALAAFALSLLQAAANDHPPRWDAALYAWLATGLLYLVCLPYASTMPSQTGAAGWLSRALLWGGPALVLGLAFTPRESLRRLVLPAGSQPLKPAWYAAAFLFFPLALLAGYAIDLALGGPVQVTFTGSVLEIVLTITASLVYMTLFGGPLGEESGWRGYALPRLQARLSPLLASLLLAVAWVLWRLPLMFGTAFTDLLPLLLSPFLTAFLYTWLYNRTRGDLLACLLFHAAATTALVFLPLTPAAIGILAASSLAVVIAGRMWRMSA